MSYSPKDGKHIEAILFVAYEYGIHQEVSISVTKYLATHNLSPHSPRAYVYENAFNQEYFKKFGIEYHDTIIY